MTSLVEAVECESERGGLLLTLLSNNSSGTRFRTNLFSISSQGGSISSGAPSGASLAAKTAHLIHGNPHMFEAPEIQVGEVCDGWL